MRFSRFNGCFWRDEGGVSECQWRNLAAANSVLIGYDLLGMSPAIIPTVYASIAAFPALFILGYLRFRTNEATRSHCHLAVKGRMSLMTKYGINEEA